MTARIHRRKETVGARFRIGIPRFPNLRGACSHTVASYEERTRRCSPLERSALRREAREEEGATCARYAGSFPRAGTVRLRSTSKAMISPKSRATDTSSSGVSLCPDGRYVYSFFSSIADGSC